MGATKDRPPRLRRPPLADDPCHRAPERTWGWAVQLYALRSRESWGVGDFADLRRFGRWSRRAGASLILLNPLGAQTPTHPYQPSPYYASTRRFRNVVYLRVEEVQGAEGIDLSAEREAAQRLNAQRIIDYDRVFELKSKALEKIFRVAPEPDGLASFARRQGEALRDFATFNAVCEIHGPAWRSWPKDIGRLDPDRVANGFARLPGHLHDLVRAEVGRHHDDRVLEVHRAALAVGEPAVVEDLEQHIEDIAVGLLDLVQ